MTTNVLIVDNHEGFLKTRSEFLTREGYDVTIATSPAEARQKLKAAQVDIMITDIRLLDDNDDKDTSGITLAKDSDAKIPKIIMTNFPTVDGVRAALRPSLEGLSPVIDFISKAEGPEAMLAAVRRAVAVHIKEDPREVSLNISEMLERDYEEARKQAVLTHRIRLILVVVGAIVIVAGAVNVVVGETDVGILSVISGVLVESLGLFFAKLSEDANKRMDRYHKELLKLYMNNENK